MLGGAPILTTIPLALLSGVLVIVPLALRLVFDRERDGRTPTLLAAGAVTGVPGAVAAAAAILLPPGPTAAWLSAGWAAATALLAAHGIVRLAGRGLRPVHELAVSAGFVNLGIGGGWLTVTCAGATPLGFPPIIVALTAVHFHFAGFVLPACIGLLGRDGRSRLVAASAALVVASVPLTAIGIAVSRPVELVAAAALVASGAGAGVATLRAARRRPPLARTLLAISALSLLAAMPLALAYAAAWPLPSVAGLSRLELMALTHGAVNLGGFALAGLVGWSLRPPPPARALPPFSLLAAGGRVGADFFARSGACSTDPERRPTGLVDRLEDLAHRGCAVERIHERVRAFYERTDAHALTVLPRWRPGFRAGGRAWARLARTLGQLQLPVVERSPDAVASEIVPLDGARDGRDAPRGWTRTFEDGRAMYVAAYATHRAEGVAYMNIAFPLPGANLASILRMENRGEAGVVLTTRNPRGEPGDAGIWLVLRPGRRRAPLKLPMAETIEVWPTGDPAVPGTLAAAAPVGATVVARHRIWLLGLPFLALDYVITDRAAPARAGAHEADALA